MSSRCSSGESPAPSFYDGFRCQQVLEGQGFVGFFNYPIASLVRLSGIPKAAGTAAAADDAPLAALTSAPVNGSQK